MIYQFNVFQIVVKEKVLSLDKKISKDPDNINIKVYKLRAILLVF